MRIAIAASLVAYGCGSPTVMYPLDASQFAPDLVVSEYVGIGTDETDDGGTFDRFLAREEIEVVLDAADEVPCTNDPAATFCFRSTRSADVLVRVSSAFGVSQVTRPIATATPFGYRGTLRDEPRRFGAITLLRGEEVELDMQLFDANETFVDGQILGVRATGAIAVEGTRDMTIQATALGSGEILTDSPNIDPFHVTVVDQGAIKTLQVTDSSGALHGPTNPLELGDFNSLTGTAYVRALDAAGEALLGGVDVQVFTGPNLSVAQPKRGELVVTGSIPDGTRRIDTFLRVQRITLIEEIPVVILAKR